MRLIGCDAAVAQALGLRGLTAGVRRSWPCGLGMANHRTANGPGVLVVGDAASLCDPFLPRGSAALLSWHQQAAASLDDCVVGDGGSLAG